MENYLQRFLTLTDVRLKLNNIYFLKTLLGLISVPRHGFTEENLVDIISGDDVVLTDVFQFHEPPVRRLPNMLMKRLLTEISEYVCKPAVNGQIVLRYFHRQFYKFFKQYRQKELYQLALAFLDGTLHDKYPARQISVEKEENSAIVSSELLSSLDRLHPFSLK